MTYEELQQKLAEVEAERESLRRSLHDETVALGCMKIRAETSEQLVATLEAQLPRAYRMGLEAGASHYDEKAAYWSDLCNDDMRVEYEIVAKAIRALPTPTPAELQARLKEKDDG